MAAPVYRLRTPTGTGAEMLQFKSANGSRASRRWAKSGKAKTFPRGKSLKVYRASRWSGIGLIGDPGPKTVLDEGRLSHGGVYEESQVGARAGLGVSSPSPIENIANDISGYRAAAAVLCRAPTDA